ncbi:MAG: flagellar biosynthetic protein FliR [Buchnera aphidicola (Pentalonia nigronervosa)]|jgi:flagellar biosynthetic protein FliR|uniref:Flagellar biosynthetic protein FliR n=1 Tax=Buchnera aphidicola (Pentalonia nigronervosa) TaxID=1309793 RepID=A0A7H1AZC2_9GAMM|nr:MAG: flagellar biosynthetic protein FliR [Buchnera aphidicola (Pentalonia nigronervosa)]
MITFNSTQLIALISSFFWPLIRIFSFFSTAVFFDNKIISRKSKIILSSLISWLIFPFLPTIDIELFSCFGIITCFYQILIGIVLGLTTQFIFSAISLSGEIIGLQMGLSFATFFNHNNYIGVSIISRFLNILMFCFFLALNAHLDIISVLVNSFNSIPINIVFIHKNTFLILLQFFSHIFLDSIILIFPIMICLLALNFVMSLLNRISSQISIFSIGFPLNLLIGMLMLYLLISDMLPIFKNMLIKLLSLYIQIF